MTHRVALHGFTGSPRSFSRVTHLTARKVATLAPALVGHGAPPAGEGFEGEVHRLWAAVDDAGDAPVELVGYSLGARVALRMLLARPDRVRRAILVGVHPGLEDGAERAARVASDARWQELLRGRGIQAFVDAWERQPLFASQHRAGPAALDEQRRERLAHDPEGLAESLERTGLGRMAPAWAELHRLECPVDLVVGSLDARFRDLATRFATLAPRARITTVADSGHNVLLEAPAALAAVLDREEPA